MIYPNLTCETGFDEHAPAVDIDHKNPPVIPELKPFAISYSVRQGNNVFPGVGIIGATDSVDAHRRAMTNLKEICVPANGYYEYQVGVMEFTERLLEPFGYHH